MFFNKKTLSSRDFCRNYLWPLLHNITRDCTLEIINALKQQNIKFDKNKEDIELEAGIWQYHITGKLLGQIKILGDSQSFELVESGQEMFECFYDQWGQKKNHEEFIIRLKKRYFERVKAYQTYESLYSQSKMTLQDFEACVAVILLGVKYKDLTHAFVQVIEELHKGSTVLILEFLKKSKKKYKVVS